MQTAGEPENWTVEFIRADGEMAPPTMGGFASVADAEYYGQCLWAGPQGRGITGVNVREHSQDDWDPVMPASVCGAVRI